MPFTVTFLIADYTLVGICYITFKYKFRDLYKLIFDIDQHHRNVYLSKMFVIY